LLLEFLVAYFRVLVVLRRFSFQAIRLMATLQHKVRILFRAQTRFSFLPNAFNLLVTTKASLLDLTNTALTTPLSIQNRAINLVNLVNLNNK
jgi:hypothetical protein